MGHPAKKKVEGEFDRWDKAVLIPIDRLVFSDWNCNEMSPKGLAELQSEIEDPSDPKSDRFDEPLQIVPMKKGKFLVLGGEHRTKVMTALDKDKVPCVIRHDLVGKSRAELIQWSVRRNNLRGRINQQKYAEIEAELVDQHGLDAEVARNAMLIDGPLLKALRRTSAVRANEGAKNPDASPAAPTEPPAHDSDYDEIARRRSQHELLQALKLAEQDVLLESADTVEHGYLFFAQGGRGQTHLVVDESKKLWSLVQRMVGACKKDSAKIDDFLCSAIKAELKNWE